MWFVVPIRRLRSCATFLSELGAGLKPAPAVCAVKSYFFLSIACAVFGALLIAVFTPWGLGLSPDSAVYVGAARSLLLGKGYAIPTSSADFARVIHFPPLYSALLASIGLLHVDPLTAAKWLNVILFAASIFVAGCLVARCAPGLSPAIMASLLMLSSAGMVQAHSMVWSEPLFLFLQLAAILLLLLYFDNPNQPILYASAALAGVSVLTRYSGFALVFSGILCIMFLDRRSWSDKARSAVLFFIGGSVPIALWMMRNFSSGQGAVNRQFGFHPLTTRQWEQLFDTMSGWLLPYWVSPMIRGLGLTVALPSLIFAILVWRRTKISSSSKTGLDAERLLIVTGVIAVAHLAVLFASIIFLDAQIPIDSRILLPVYTTVVLFCVALISGLFENGALRKQVKPGFLAGALFICALQVTDVSSWLNLSYREGVGYASREWKTSAVIEKLSGLPSQAYILSNAPDVVYTLLGRPSEMIPRKVFPDTRRPNEQYTNEIESLKKKLKETGGVVAYFHRVHWRWYLPSEQEIQKDLELRPIARENDGSLYRAEGGSDFSTPLSLNPAVAPQNTDRFNLRT